MHPLIKIGLFFLFGMTHAVAANPPRQYLIPNVPQFNEITGLNCGPASLESVFAYWGPDIAQREIADVARTSSIGTYVFDMVRAGHFSAMSGAQGRFYPHHIPSAGYTARNMGYAAFGHAQSTSWLDGLKALVAQDIPPILLMLYSPDPNSGGHYRVMVGYNDDLQQAYFIDPWGRDLNRFVNADGTVTWSYTDLLTAWNYAQYGTTQPYFAAVLLPWRVSLTARNINLNTRTFKLTAQASYPCPAPFDCTLFPASNTQLHLQLPAGGYLINGNDTIALGEIPAGNTARAEWTIGGYDGSAPFNVSVTASGEIQGAVPAAAWEGNQASYPPYAYTDRIGGTAKLTLP